ncbi:MAG: anthranilate phosphoribosyltransferase [Gemmatimonadaceae bacterium]|nr:anthranilate phosphoribosyltransferase [Gemmatimonadaceae bacterium]
MTSIPDNAVLAAIRKLAFHEALSSTDATAAFDQIMKGDATSTQVAGLLAGLRVKGESAAIVAGVAKALRNAMVHLEARNPEELVDTCGTGGGTVPTFNISTAAALLAAGMGIRVAKHGNRSFTSKCGSADVLEALDVRIEVDPERMARALDEAGLVFMFAPLMHPAMKHVGPVRRELGIPTVMNIVGPLANPASAQRQVIGVADLSRGPMLAEALLELGTIHSMVVHGEPGLDELSPMGVTHVWEVRDGRLSEWTVQPGDFGFSIATADELAGGSPEENAQIILEVLGGKGNAGAAAAVVLNAGAAVYVSGIDPDLKSAVHSAKKALEAGAGIVALQRLRSAYLAP